jgi:hypothetical protein
MPGGWMAAGPSERLSTMKADVKAQWVKDLRSGEYEQGGGHLRRDNGEGEKDQFCCLGVLCEQAVRAGVIPAPELHGQEYLYLDDKYDTYGGNVTGEAFNQASSLPRKVAEWAGLPRNDDGHWADDVIIEPAGGEEDAENLSAIAANDGVGLPFAEIADLIEKNVPVTE